MRKEMGRGVENALQLRCRLPDGLDLSGTDLVVLAACKTGAGEVQVGEGVYGLRRAFTFGAKNLVRSLWNVSDKLSQIQMKAFYKAYGDGKSPAEALRHAQIEMIQAYRAKNRTELGVPLAPVDLWAPVIVQQTGELLRTGPFLPEEKTASW